MVTKFKQMTSILGAAFTLIASNAFGQSFDFKGLVLGAHVDARTLEEQHHLTCRTASAQSASPQARSCAGQTTFLGMPGTEKVLVNGQGIVTQIDVVYSTTTVWPKDVAAELSKKYGSPKYQKQNMIFTWVNSKNELLHLEHRSLTMKLPVVAPKNVPPNLIKKDL